ncbi:hypothetical protein IKE84_02050 [Candidatus Saccharibacteria bacterium]|nr:hypothetical protein [Candidatus Saccharibacteria bacterium]
MKLGAILALATAFFAIPMMADTSAKRAGRKEGIGVAGYISYVVAMVIVAFLSYHFLIFAIITSIMIGALALMNREGKLRAMSWAIFEVLIAIMMTFAIVAVWDKNHKPDFSMFQFQLIPLFFAALALIRGKLLDVQTERTVAFWNKEGFEEKASAVVKDMSAKLTDDQKNWIKVGAISVTSAIVIAVVVVKILI